jgi:hypothetical protein
VKKWRVQKLLLKNNNCRRIMEQRIKYQLLNKYVPILVHPVPIQYRVQVDSLYARLAVMHQSSKSSAPIRRNFFHRRSSQDPEALRLVSSTLAEACYVSIWGNNAVSKLGSRWKGRIHTWAANELSDSVGALKWQSVAHEIHRGRLAQEQGFSLQHAP